MVALFCGSRGWVDVDTIRADIDALPVGSVIIEGGARGADRIARQCARDRGLHVATVEAYWDLFGRSAGVLRNQAMRALRPEVAYAYPLGGPGTRDMLRGCRREGVPVVERG